MRGRSRSISIQTILDEARELEKSGYHEMVVTGTHLGAYGRDLQPRMRLSDILQMILKSTKEISIRVSSLEPTTLTRDFIELVRNEDRIRPHFHIPLQSGSDTVLRRMNRKYRMKNFVERVEALSQTRNHVGIGTDVIVGYSCETQAEFQETVQRVENLPLTYLHVFPFSPREGTKAKAQPDNVPSKLKKERVQILRSISQKKRNQFHKKFIGSVQRVIVEKKRDSHGRLSGYTGQYIPIRFLGGDRLVNQEVEIRMLKLEGEVVLGEVI